MNGDEYIIYRCNKCNLEFIVPVDGLRLAKVLQRYFRCPLCHGGIKEKGRFDKIKECMNQKYSELI